MDYIQAHIAHNIAYDAGNLPMWVIYNKPSDFPDSFIARMHIVNAGGHNPTAAYVVGKTLEDVRNQLPPGLVCLGRDKGDDSKIVETWT